MSFNIYMISNKINNKKFISYTRWSLDRILAHNLQYSKNASLIEDVEAHGKDAFSINLLKQVEDFPREQTQALVEEYNTMADGYNLTRVKSTAESKKDTKNRCYQKYRDIYRLKAKLWRQENPERWNEIYTNSLSRRRKVNP